MNKELIKTYFKEFSHWLDGESFKLQLMTNMLLENNKFMDKDTHNSLEVIGNIYENKELLKEVDENR